MFIAIDRTKYKHHFAFSWITTRLTCGWYLQDLQFAWYHFYMNIRAHVGTQNSSGNIAPGLTHSQKQG